MSFDDPDPAVVRIRNLDATGFDIRIQEWDYLDGVHAHEVVDYLVMERGHHVLVLDDGTTVEVEAGSISTNNMIGALAPVSFVSALPTTPVVFTAVATLNEADAVTTRVQGITNSGFQVGMQTFNGSNAANLRWQNESQVGVDIWVAEEQSNDSEISHTTEVVGYGVFGLAAQ